MTSYHDVTRTTFEKKLNPTVHVSFRGPRWHPNLCQLQTNVPRNHTDLSKPPHAFLSSFVRPFARNVRLIRLQLSNLVHTSLSISLNLLRPCCGMVMELRYLLVTSEILKNEPRSLFPQSK